MKKLLFFTMFATGINTCLTVDTSNNAEVQKKLLEETNKKWQEEDSKLAKQALQNKVTQLRKCAKDKNNADDQIRCVLALEALRELLLNPKAEITDLSAKVELSNFLEDGSKQPTGKKLKSIFQGTPITEIA